MMKWFWSSRLSIKHSLSEEDLLELRDDVGHVALRRLPFAWECVCENVCECVSVSVLLLVAACIVKLQGLGVRVEGLRG